MTKCAALRETWIVRIVDRCANVPPVESGDFLDCIGYLRWIESQLLEGERSNRIADELELFEPGLVATLTGMIPFGPEILVTDFVSCQRLQFARAEEGDRGRGNQDDCARVQGNGGRPDIYHSDLVPVAPRRPEQLTNRVHFPLLQGGQFRHLAFGRKRFQYRRHGFGRYRCGPGSFKRLNDRSRLTDKQVAWIPKCQLLRDSVATG